MNLCTKKRRSTDQERERERERERVEASEIKKGRK
jgi:hypothetical protein